MSKSNDNIVGFALALMNRLKLRGPFWYSFPEEGEIAIGDIGSKNQPKSEFEVVRSEDQVMALIADFELRR